MTISAHFIYVSAVAMKHFLCGETLTFAVAGRFLGTPLDEYRYDQLEVELIGKVRTGLFK